MYLSEYVLLMVGTLASLVREFAEQRLPNGIKDTLRDAIASRSRDRVVTYRELANNDDVRTWYFDRERNIEFGEPDFYNNLPREIDRLLGTHAVHQPYIIEVPDIELIGKQGFKRTADGQYIYFNFDRGQTDNVAGEYAYDVVDALADGNPPFWTPLGSGAMQSFKTAVPLVHRWATNYSHWTEEWLPLIEGLQYYTTETGVKPTIIVPRNPPSFVPQSLKLLGYDEDDYVEWTNGRARVERMVLPSIRRCYSDTSNDYMRMISGLRWLRDAVLETIDTEGGPTRLFISRQDADTRRIHNHDEVWGLLDDLGFERVVLTELNYVEQKQLFSRAEMIVATHGAGLNEIVFSPNAAVLELYGNYFVPVFYEIADGLGLPYGCLRCEDVSGDVMVDLEELQRGIDTLLDG